MTTIPNSLLFALGNVLHPRMLWLMLWPVMISLAIWGTVAIAFWAQLVATLAAFINEWLLSAQFLASYDLSAWALFVAKAMILIGLVPLIQLTALLILGVFGMQAMVDHVARRAYPGLARRQGGSFAGSVWNSVVALLGLVGLGLLSLPLWVFPPLWPLIPVAIMGWVNQRVLRYDALAEHGDGQEMAQVFHNTRGSLYVLGALLALIAYIPLVGFFAPVLFGLAMIHYLLAGLQALRKTPVEGRVVG
jgi:CysZ protein